MNRPGDVNRLFRHDRSIAWNALRANSSGWHDCVIAIVMLLAAAAVARAGLAERPWPIAAWATAVTGLAIGLGAGRLVAARLAFHAYDGVLAADALHPPARRRYAVAWHGFALALAAVATLIVRPSLLTVSIPAYLVGMMLAGATTGVRLPWRTVRTMRPGWTARAWSHRPIAGVAAATILFLLLLPGRALSTDASMAVAVIAATFLGLMLTTVDDGIVRFMTMAGHGSRRIFGDHAKGHATFFALAVPGCWLVFGPIAAVIVATVSIGTLLLLALRILAYRLHGKRFADILVSILAGLLVVVAYSMSVALPVVALAMLWQLQRKGRAKTWLLA